MSLVLSEGRAVSVIPSTYAAIRENVNLVQRRLDDMNWDSLSRDSRSNIDDEDRLELIARAQITAKRSPLARQGIALLKHYTLGQGVSLKAKNRRQVAKLVDELMNHPVNKRALTSHEGLKRAVERRFVDGDYFLTLFPDDTAGTLHMGSIDADLVVDVVMDPENALIPKWYKVKAPKTKYNFNTDSHESVATGEYVYYRDWQNEDEAPSGMGAKLQAGLVYQWSHDRGTKFGRSGLASALDWLRAHRDFMQDRASLNKAATAVAWRKKRRGPASDIAAEAQRLASSVVSNIRAIDSNPPRSTAATIVENDGTSLDWVKTDTGGAAADYDERKLRMMAGAGMGGVPNHYFGDEANANLATATSMELPLLKHYEDEQQSVRTILTDVIEFYLAVCHKAGRIGERDDSSRYADRATTPQAVMAQPDQAKAGQIGEALANPIPYQGPPAPGPVRLMPKPEGADLPEEEPDPDAAVDWYVDIDFPPIIQKDVDTFMNAVEKLMGMVPSENIEARKFVVELALSVFGVNDIDKAMETIFPADMIAVLPPPSPVGIDPATGRPFPPPNLGPDGKPIPFPVAEGAVDFRRRRILRAASDAAVAYALPLIDA